MCQGNRSRGSMSGVLAWVTAASSTDAPLLSQVRQAALHQVHPRVRGGRVVHVEAGAPGQPCRGVVGRRTPRSTCGTLSEACSRTETGLATIVPTQRSGQFAVLVEGSGSAGSDLLRKQRCAERSVHNGKRLLQVSTASPPEHLRRCFMRDPGQGQWVRGLGSNQRPLGLQPSVLPLNYPGSNSQHCNSMPPHALIPPEASRRHPFQSSLHLWIGNIHDQQLAANAERHIDGPLGSSSALLLRVHRVSGSHFRSMVLPGVGGGSSMRQSLRLTRVRTMIVEDDFRSAAGKAPLQANTCNSLRTVGRHLERLSLRHSAMPANTLASTADSIAHRRRVSAPIRPARVCRADPATDSRRGSFHASTERGQACGLASHAMRSSEDVRGAPPRAPSPKSVPGPGHALRRPDPAPQSSEFAAVVQDRGPEGEDLPRKQWSAEPSVHGGKGDRINA